MKKDFLLELLIQDPLMSKVRQLDETLDFLLLADVKDISESISLEDFEKLLKESTSELESEYKGLMEKQKIYAKSNPKYAAVCEKLGEKVVTTKNKLVDKVKNFGKDSKRYQALKSTAAQNWNKLGRKGKIATGAVAGAAALGAGYGARRAMKKKKT